METAQKNFNKYKARILKPGETFDFENKQFLSKDNFFLEEDEDEREDEQPVQRIEVDKRGNVIKKSKQY